MGGYLLADGNATYQGAITASIIGAIVALSLVVVTGYVGQISLAQMTFAGIGALRGLEARGGERHLVPAVDRDRRADRGTGRRADRASRAPGPGCEPGDRHDRCRRGDRQLRVPEHRLVGGYRRSPRAPAEDLFGWSIDVQRAPAALRRVRARRARPLRVHRVQPASELEDRPAHAGGARQRARRRGGGSERRGHEAPGVRLSAFIASLGGNGARLPDGQDRVRALRAAHVGVLRVDRVHRRHRERRAARSRRGRWSPGGSSSRSSASSARSTSGRG